MMPCSTKSLIVGMIDQLVTTWSHGYKFQFVSNIVHAPNSTVNKLICKFNIKTGRYDNFILTDDWKKKFPDLKNLLNRFNIESQKIKNLNPMKVHYGSKNIYQCFKSFKFLIII